MVWPCLKVFWFSEDNPTGYSERKTKRGRQKKRWEDNIKEWTGMGFTSSTRATDNRSRWKGIVANSSVVPRRPSKVMGWNRIKKLEILLLCLSVCPSVCLSVSISLSFFLSLSLYPSLSLSLSLSQVSIQFPDSYIRKLISKTK